MKNIEIIIRHQCEECNGDGAIANPVWQAFFKDESDHRLKTGQNFTTLEEQNWWNKRGFHLYPQRLPLEENGCDSCGGQGVIERYISIEEFKQIFSPPTDKT